MAIGVVVIGAILCSCVSATAQNVAEVRLADSKYRYVDWNHAWASGVVVDLFYVPVSGSVTSYQVLDTLDFTRTLSSRWEVGVQAGFFHSGDAWNPQVGPVLKVNDHFGGWAVSYRFGPENEFRVGRVLTF